LLVAISLLFSGVALARTPPPPSAHLSSNATVQPEKSKAQIQTQTQPKVQTPRTTRSSRLRVRTAPTASSFSLLIPRQQPRTKRITPMPRVPHTMERLRYQLELLELQGH
jgi:hypothetical protein